MARAFVGTLVFLLMTCAVLFASAGRFDWAAGWVVVSFFAFLSVAGLMMLDPALIRERSSVPPGMQLLDVLIASTAFVLLYPVTLFAGGLDFRFGWSPGIPPALRAGALLIVVLGYAFALWAARTNPFFSTVVRIQAERGHHVIDTGPYAFVRHPGYAGPILAHLALPIVLGSLYGLVPAITGVGFLMLRAVLEEGTLVRDLPGYADYAARVRWRLVPGLW